MPDSVTDTGGGVFANCPLLKSVKLSANLTSIPLLYKGGNSSFEFIEENYYGYFTGCTSLENIYTSDSAEIIRYGAFQGCTALEELYMPDSVTSVENVTFSNCTSLEEVTIGKGIKKLSSAMFEDCISFFIQWLYFP